jgi:hypothetical protein
MDIRTYAWTTEAPGDIEHAELAKADAEVPAYVAELEAAAREQGFSFAVYDKGACPWAVVRWYAADLGLAGDGPCQAYRP